MTKNGSSWAAAQIQGARAMQEDSFDVLECAGVEKPDSAMQVFALADGMGGHAGGDAASGIAARAIMDAYGQTSGPVTDRLRQCLDAANDAVAHEVDDNPQLSGMGTTLVVAVTSPRGLEWISVGDSPLWLHRNGRLQRLNADHSMAPVLAHFVQTGEMSAAEAAADKRRNGLRSAVCGDEMPMIDVSSQPLALQPGDLIVLASDGIDTLSVEELAVSLAQAPKVGLDALVADVLNQVRSAEKPNQDNTTLMVCAPLGWAAGTGLANGVSPTRSSPQRPASAQRRIAALWLAAAGLALIAAMVALVVR